MSALLGDTPQRDYARKLSLFNRCAGAELQAAVELLSLAPGMRVLDAGCGTGETLQMLAAAVAPGGVAVGLDLAAAHTAAARAVNAPTALVVQGNLTQPPLAAGQFDLIWCANTLNHLADPGAALKRLALLLTGGGRVALAQSSMLPDMYFAWDERLERAVTEGVRRYYRDRYGLNEAATTGIRALVGLVRRAGFCNVRTHTLVIERIGPLSSADSDYLLEAIFNGTWGERLAPYLSTDDYARVQKLCNPDAPEFALRRADFHFLQTLTLVTGHKSMDGN
jgi:SAM-dependent methyltransferase